MVIQKNNMDKTERTEERKALTAEMKATLLRIIAKGYITAQDIETLSPSPIPESLTDEELQEEIERLRMINLGLTEEGYREYKRQETEWLRNIKPQYKY